jgi:hypothetical protein
VSFLEIKSLRAFQTQLEKRDDGKMWLRFASAFILIAIALTAWFISINQSTLLSCH